jgi:hypothetical protein
MVESLLVFEEVKKCVDVAAFNLFVRRYLAARVLIADGHHSNTSKVYWALFYAWKG